MQTEQLEQIEDLIQGIEAAKILSDAINDLPRAYAKAAKRHRELEAELKATKAEMDRMAQPLLDHFGATGTERVTVDGVTIYLHPDIWPKFKTNEEGEKYTRADVMKALRESGLSDYISETYNAQSFAAYIRELHSTGVELPEALAAVVEPSETYSLRTRIGR